MKTEEILKSKHYKDVLELIKSVLPVIIYPNEPESLALNICKLTSDVSDERMNYMRNQALSVIELTKGFTTEPTDNAMKTLLEFTDYILELTNGQIPKK